MKRHVVLIHGIGGRVEEFRATQRALNQQGYKVSSFSYSRRFGQASIEELAQEFHEFCENLTNTEIDIVALSMGGIIAMKYMMQPDAKHVGRLITVCTPHRGSLLAHLLSLPGTRDLRPRSGVLREVEKYLQKSNTKLFAVYTPFDLMILPGWYAMPITGTVKKIYAPMHRYALNWPATQKFILESLEEPQKKNLRKKVKYLQQIS